MANEHDAGQEYRQCDEDAAILILDLALARGWSMNTSLSELGTEFEEGDATKQ